MMWSLENCKQYCEHQYYLLTWCRKSCVMCWKLQWNRFQNSLWGCVNSLKSPWVYFSQNNGHRDWECSQPEWWPPAEMCRGRPSKDFVVQKRPFGLIVMPGNSSSQCVGTWPHSRHAVSFDHHVSNTVQSCNYHIHSVRHVRPLIDRDVATAIIYAIVTSRIDYCNSFMA